MFNYAISLVARRKLRTVLTSLGITIAVILLSLIIFGMQDLRTLLVSAIQTQFKSNEIFITNSSGPGAFNPPSSESTDVNETTLITQEVVNDITKIDGVTNIVPVTVVNNLEIKLDGQDKAYAPAFISGWDLTGDDSYFVNFWGDKSKPTGDNIFVSKFVADFYNVAPEELIGKKVSFVTSKSALFGTVKTKEILDKKYDYTIKGVFDPGSDRNDAIISLTTSTSILADIGGFDSKEEYVSSVGYDLLRVTGEENKLQSIKSAIDEKYNFQGIFTADDVLGFLDDIIQAFTIALFVFGAISAVIAAIGITNTMIMSIYEQTKEIGILKSMGASNMQILGVFLIQSALIGLLGGVAGLIIVILSMQIGNIFIVEQLNEIGFQVDTFFNFDLVSTLI
ncbi:MAG: FtsX-like permease family protein, partial [Candidatus Paceibacterota bacterium]